MILEHYSHDPLEWPPRNFEQTYNQPGWGWPPKPCGLWVSVKGDDDWPGWVKSAWEEHANNGALSVCTRIILSPEANLKVIQGEAELIAFDREWGVDYDYNGRVDFVHRRIDWVKLAKAYDGVVIAPYVWSCRLPMEWPKQERGKISDWYYPWDCASGCIWNGTKAIAGFEVTEGAAIAAE